MRAIELIGVSGLLLVSGCKEALCLFPPASNTALCAITEGECFRGPIQNDEFIVKVVDEETQEPIVGAVGSHEKGCLYCAGHNSYYWGGITDENGEMRIKVPSGERDVMGLHTFQNGYLYGRAKCDATEHNRANIPMRKNPDSDKPVVSNAATTTTSVRAGEQFTLRLDLQEARGAKNSDETLWVQPETGKTGRLKPTAGEPPDPPAEYPNGEYTDVITAPSAPGTYRYVVHATAHNCVTSDRAEVTLTVNP
ncbi:MAG: hypothetical protein AB2A00_18435 [Myxococcota bacterium]